MINTTKLIDTIIQPNIKILLLIAVIVILMFQYFDTNIILILTFILTVFIYHKNIIDTFNDIRKKETPIERIIEDNKRKSKELIFDEQIEQILKKLRKYRKYNQNAYDDGYNYIKMFVFNIHDLEKDNISHPKQYFENAEIYLEKSLNNFQSISISAPEETFNNALKYNKYETTKISNRIGKLCKKLHKHCYYLLFNLSQRFNKDWSDNPDIAYMESIIDETSNLYNIDLSRIYVSGHSRGAALSIIASFERPDLFAGYCAQAGFASNNDYNLRLEDLVDSQRTPGILIHGDADPDVRVNESDQINQIFEDAGWEHNIDWKYFRIKDATHEWQSHLNQEMWDWLYDHPNVYVGNE